MNKNSGYEHEKTKELIEKFFDGNTSLTEERQLYRYFNGRNVDTGLEQYRDIFVCFGNMAEDCHDTSKQTRTTVICMLFRTVAAAAAVILTVIGIARLEKDDGKTKLASIYSGSYVIKNGKRIDNLKDIQPIIEQTLDDAEHIERMAGEQNVINTAEQEILDNIHDKYNRERIIQLLNN